MRKVKDVVVDLGGDNRDNGKRFRLTEMPAQQAEKWAIRATVALANAQVQIPQEMLNAGWAALAYGALEALHRIKYEDLVPLLDEMMECIQRLEVQPDHPEHPPFARVLFEEDIEEIATRFWLRAELFSLHSGFSFADVRSSLTPAQAPSDRSPSTRTSRRLSRRRSAVA
jgi:hypothetical protein